MLVQKRDVEAQNVEKEEFIMVRVATGSQWHDIAIQATSTFGEMKMVLALVTGMEPKEQRLLFKGKERDNDEHLHMVGVRDKDKVVVLEDPAIKEMKLHRSLATTSDIGASNHAISV
ncbi:ubiquitin-like superfamily protein [Artemisia annua]|uniref:Ubiquitin-like superfamily protein n=1 Tax=Artemisia annua TaxID=35608 RepID=A0A2U1L8F1_ARTAN|nr:ubiquitin-like superfamily protein [Artemisia annua]